MTMRVINNIVAHCTATPQTTTIEAIKRYWREVLKWKSPGYHIIILPDGTPVELLPIEQVSNGVAGHNHDSINISYIGGVDAKNKAVDNRTEAQKTTMLDLFRKYKAMFPKAKIMGHRDFPGVKKECPSFNAPEWFKAHGIV